jgi:hypothetical protein
VRNLHTGVKLRAGCQGCTATARPATMMAAHGISEMSSREAYAAQHTVSNFRRGFRTIRNPRAILRHKPDCGMFQVVPARWSRHGTAGTREQWQRKT